MFFAQFWQLQSQKQWSSHTNSRYVISQCDDLIYFRNDRIRDLQSYTCSRKSFASILDSDSLFDSQWSLNRVQFADAVKSISSSICLAIDSHRSSLESKAMRYRWESLFWEYWFGEVTKVVCFSNLSLMILLLWESHYFERVLDRVNLFCFYISRSLYHSFRKNIMIWRSLACCCFIVCSSLVLSSFISSYFEEVIDLRELKVCCFLLIVEKWLFFFVVASSWSSTITHLFSTFCDSLSNDKYERERVTVQLRRSVQSQEEESDVTVQLRESVLYNQKKKNRCVTVQLRESVLFSYQEQMWQYSFEKAYYTVTATVSLLQWRTFSESATMMYSFERAYSSTRLRVR